MATKVKKVNDLTMENARIVFRNFAGEKTQFNAKGDRNFAVIIPEEIVPDLKNDGWNVKQFKQREEGEPIEYYLQVAVRYDNFPPKIFLVNGRKKVLLNADTVEQLDYAEIVSSDLIISPYCYEVMVSLVLRHI